MANEATCKIDQERPDQANKLAHGHNAELTDMSNLDPNLIREPDYHVYIFSVADRSFDVSRPSLNIARLKTAYNPEALTDPTAYAFVLAVAHPYPLPYADQVSGEIKLNTVYADRAAMDICNPNNKTTNLDAYVAPDSIIGAGDDLVSKGLFFVNQNRCKYVDDKGIPCAKDTKVDGKLVAKPVPPKDLVNAATDRKRKYYQGLMDKAQSLEYSDHIKLTDFVTAEPDVHLACEYFGVETSWHKIRSQKVVPVDCTICGSEMKKGAGFHPLPGSRLGVCINDWDKAIQAGVVGEDDRPA